MALNTFILDMLNGKDSSFEVWRVETLANQKKTHEQHMHYLQHHLQPQNDYESQVTEYIETQKRLRDEFVKKKTSASLRKWLTHYSSIPDKTNVSEIYTAFS